MTWVRKGLIFADHSYSHAQCPTAAVLSDRIRIFYADRDAHNRSYIAYFDTYRESPDRIIAVHGEPIIALGKPGTFDDSGMMPSCIVNNGKFLLYYSGWNKGSTVPYRNSIGLLVSDYADEFSRHSEGPVMDRSSLDPIMCVTPWVEKDRMWYVSGLRWDNIDGHLEPIYVIKHARANTTHWVPSIGVCIKQEHPQEAFSNPTVIHDEEGYRMWFCSRDSHDYRGGDGSYRIRSARSHDGYAWERTDDGLNVGEGWESDMTCYPYCINVDGRLLMFYNGNSFGKTGIGLAEWVA